MTKIEKAISQSGIFAFTMRYKPDFPTDFHFGANPFSKDETVLFGDIVHPDDFQPFCEIINDIVNRRADNIKAHARIMCGGEFRWFYISAVPEFTENDLLVEINGAMYDVTAYLDCENNTDPVMREIQDKSKAAFQSAEHTPRLTDILGEDYLSRIQQPFTFIENLYSVITDENGRVIAAAPGQNPEINLNKMSYQRKKHVRIKHQNAASWIIASESPEAINKCVPLLDTMVQTLSEIANGYIVISEEMENSQNANKLLGQNFEDQILVNNIYSLILQSKDTTTAFASVIPLIKEYFGLDDLIFCADAQRPVKVYRWDESGAIIPMTSNNARNDEIDRKLENDAVVCVNESDLRFIGSGKNRSFAMSRIYENGVTRGVIVFISRTVGRTWTNRDRKAIRSVTQIMSTVIYRSFVENELAVS